MLDKASIEHRLATLEKEVAALKQRNENKFNSDSWLNKLIGSISDEAAFIEALEYGRLFRQSDKPEEAS